MSAESVARWNAILMERSEVDRSSGTHPMKRARDDMDIGDNSDDVSLVSRSPSPDVKMDIDQYDEYTRGVEREVITVDTKISSNNKGFAMLAKLGWVEGQPLGLSGDGRVEPIPFVMKNDFTGLGKTNQDVRMIESTVSQRRELDSERMTRETEEQRIAREESVAKRIAVQSEISSVLKPFYCELCEKQFKNVAQYDEHTNSYAHHHKARFRDMQAAQRVNNDLDKRKEKERKREEKELRKLAKAAGIKMPKLPTPASMPGAEPPAPLNPTTEQDKTLSGSKKGGWASLDASSSFVPTQPASSSSSAGHAGIGSRSGWATVSQSQPTPSPPPPPSTHSGPAPAFRTGGWTSLDTGSTHNIPSASWPASVPPLTPSQAPPSSEPAHAQYNMIVPTPIQTLEMLRTSNFPPASRGWQSASTPPPTGPPSDPSLLPQSSSNAAPPVQPLSEPPPRQPDPAKRVEAARSGWQQFKAGSSRRR